MNTGPRHIPATGVPFRAVGNPLPPIDPDHGPTEQHLVAATQTLFAIVTAVLNNEGDTETNLRTFTDDEFDSTYMVPLMLGVAINDLAQAVKALAYSLDESPQTMWAEHCLAFTEATTL